MEIDAISLVKPPGRRSCFPALTEQVLRQDARHWTRDFHHLLREQGISLSARSFRYADIDVTEVLPTDLIAYFVYRLDPSIAPEIGHVLLDGRVHIILILSEDPLPRETDWYQNLRTLPIGRAEPIGGDLLLPTSTCCDYGYGPLIHLHELQSYGRKNMYKLLQQLLHQKEHLGLL